MKIIKSFRAFTQGRLAESEGMEYSSEDPEGAGAVNLKADAGYGSNPEEEEEHRRAEHTRGQQRRHGRINKKKKNYEKKGI